MPNRFTERALLLAAAAFAAAGVGAAAAAQAAVAPTSESQAQAESTATAAGVLPVEISTQAIDDLTESSAVAPKFIWTVDDAVRIALEDNPDLQAAAANYRAASDVVGQSVGVYLPQADISAFAGRATLPTPSAGVNSLGLLGREEPYTDALGQVRQTLFDFGKGLEQINAARSQRGSAQQQSDALRNLVVLNAQRAFYAVAAADALVEVAKAAVAQYQETYRRVSIMVKTGVRPAFDLSQAQVELSNAELSLINARDSRDLAKIALLNVMGMDRQVPYAVKATASAPWPVQSGQLDMDRLTDLALQYRPEMREGRFDVEAARDHLHGQIPDYLPTFAAEGWYGHFLPDYPDSIRHAYSFGVTANWNLFDGLLTTFRMKELSARLDQADALLKKQSQSVAAEVAAAYMSLMRAEQNDVVAEAGLVYARQNFHFARLRYEASVGTILELLIAESSLSNAQAVEVQARFRHATALDALRQAVNAPFSQAKR